MNQNHCVPIWDLDDVDSLPPPPPPPPPPPHVTTSRPHSTSMSTAPTDTSLLDYEVAELTWENGQLAMHGLGLPRTSSKSNIVSAWAEKQSTRASGTLESIVNQAITKPQSSPTFPVGACDKDALVPTVNVSQNTLVGSCSAAAAARVPVGSEWSVSLSGGGRRGRLKRRVEDTCEIVGGDLTNGLTSTSLGTSPENTKTVTVDDYDSVCHTRPQGEKTEEEEENGNNKVSPKSSMSTKRSRAAAIHNQSERKRRDKINQRMKTLQKLVPNSNKTDKASMLDEVIDYLKQLQEQVHMMNRMTMPTSMMIPMPSMQQFQMSMMSQMGMGMTMPNIGIGMDHMNVGINPMTLARTNSTYNNGIVGNNGNIFNPSNFMQPPLATTWDCPPIAHQQDMVPKIDPFSTAFLACQSQPLPMETYSRMAAMYHQLQQLQPPGRP